MQARTVERTKESTSSSISAPDYVRQRDIVGELGHSLSDLGSRRFCESNDLGGSMRLDEIFVSGKAR